MKGLKPPLEMWFCPLRARLDATLPQYLPGQSPDSVDIGLLRLQGQHIFNHTFGWKLSGIAAAQAGNYVPTITVQDGAVPVPNEIKIKIAINILPEDATLTFHGGNPVAVQVADAGGNSGAFDLLVTISESLPDLGTDPQPGDISLAPVAMTLVPVGPGVPVDGMCPAGTVTGEEYDASLRVTCSFSGVPVNSYVVQVTDSGGYYNSFGEDLLVVYDPSLGYASGGGSFYWPGTEDPETDDPGDLTKVGFTMEYNKKGTNVKGSLLLIRANGAYQVKSNALYGLSLGEEDRFFWASFSGKATYKDPDMVEPEGNHEFLVYVEDGNEPGTGDDRFWIQFRDKDRVVVPAMSMNREPTVGDNAVILDSGDLFVPHTDTAGAATTAQEPSTAPVERDRIIHLPLIIKND